MSELDWRRAAAKDLAHKVAIYEQLDELQRAVAHRREDAEHLSHDVPCSALREAIDHLLSAWFCLGEARRHLEAGE